MLNFVLMHSAFCRGVVPDIRVEIKFKMASSVIIVLRNFQHSDRDTKDILTFGK